MNRAEKRRQQKLAKKAAAAPRADSPEAHYNRGSALHDKGNLKGAITSYSRAVAIRPDFAAAHYNLGIALKDSGRLDDAVTHFETAAVLLPNVVDAQNNLGTALVELGRPADAVAAYRRSLSLAPDDAGTHFNLGVALKTLEKWDEAAASYRKAVALRPGYADAHYNLMQLFEITNRVEELRDAAVEARRACSDDPRLALGEAWILKRDGEHAAARQLLEATGRPNEDPVCLAERAYFLGGLCDRTGDVEAAFRYFTEGGRHSKAIAGRQGLDGARFRGRVDILSRRFTADWIAGWQTIDARHERPDPVFIVGFPRSGTTLLDTILRSHAAIDVVEERPAVYRMRTALRQFPGGDPDALATLAPDQLAALRHAYFATIGSARKVDSHASIIVDKLPLNIVEAGLIQRIFPNSRFLFVQRHPCDCVLSCLMQSFGLNDAMANFLDLQDAARLYDEVMTLWQHYQSVLPLAVHTVRYEDLIGAFDETISPVLDFLGLDWDDGVRNYAETARSRDRINTPSYSQVIQPLYTHARNRWERYREPMQPVLPALLRWADRFGYDD